MKLGGWSRLGVVVSGIFAIAIFIYGLESRPTVDELQRHWMSDAAGIVAHNAAIDGVTTDSYRVYNKMLASMSNEEFVEWAEKCATNPTEKQTSYSDDMAKVNAKHKAIIAKFPGMIAEFWLFQLAIWFGGTCLLFGFARIVGWVYRGFRGSHA